MKIKHIAVAAVSFGLVVPAAAQAHTELVSTSPGKGKTVGKNVRSASATFSQPIASGTITVKRKGGGKVSLGNGRRDPRKLSRVIVELNPGLSSGVYVARWSIKAADGHEQQGRFRFRLK